MKTALNRESPSKIRMTVEATPDEVAPALERAVKSLGEQVKVPGFRKGKVPRKLLETHVGRDALREATLREAIPELVERAVDGEELRPITPPSVEVTSYDLDADLTFDATIEVRPDIELPPLDGLTVLRPAAVAADLEVDEELERLQERFATLQAVARPARDGDFALIDLSASSHDRKVEELSGSDQLYEVGSGWPVPELDKELREKRTGDILKFNATLPETLGGEWGGKEITFQVLVKEIREKQLPPINDELAKTASEFDTLEELRADLRERIGKAKEAQAEIEVRNRLLESLLNEVDVEPPESLVHQEMAFRAGRLEDQLRAAGMTVDQYLQAAERTEDQIEEDIRSQAERNVRAQLILEEIGRREGFKVTEDELREEVRHHAEALRQDPAVLAKQLGEGGRILALAGDIIRRKALNFLVENADIKQEDPQGGGSEGVPAPKDE